MTSKIGARCLAVMIPAARPLLAAVGAARAAGRPEPDTDWRCVREPHDGEHMVMPLGLAGPSIRFGDQLVEPDQDGKADGAADEYHRAGVYCGEPAHCTPPYPDALPGTPYPGGHHDQPLAPASEHPRRADSDDVRRLIDLVQAPGTTAVHVNDGDELLLLLPEGDDKTIEQASQALADLFPTVTFLVLAGVTGAIVMPRRPAPTRQQLLTARADLITQGVHPDDLAMPISRVDLDVDQA